MHWLLLLGSLFPRWSSRGFCCAGLLPCQHCLSAFLFLNVHFIYLFGRQQKREKEDFSPLVHPGLQVARAAAGMWVLNLASCMDSRNLISWASAVSFCTGWELESGSEASKPTWAFQCVWQASRSVSSPLDYPLTPLSSLKIHLAGWPGERIPRVWTV